MERGKIVLKNTKKAFGLPDGKEKGRNHLEIGKKIDNR